MAPSRPRERPAEAEGTGGVALADWWSASGAMPPRRGAREPLAPTMLGNLILDLNLISRGIRYCCSGRVAAMSLATTFAIFLCSRAVFNIQYSTSLEIVAYGTIFPLTFGIECAFANRERAVQGLAEVKALASTIYMQAASWDRSGSGACAARMRAILMDMIKHMEIYCRNPLASQVSFPLRRGLNRASADHYVYDAFARLFHEIETRGPDMGYAPKGRQGGMMGKGRLWESARRMIIAWEDVKTVRYYTSPRVLRRFCFFMIHAIPILLAPYWVHFCAEDHDGTIEALDPLYGCFSGYFLGVIFCVILITLDRVRDGLDLCFEGSEEVDQINWVVWKQQLTRLHEIGADGPEIRAKADMHSVLQRRRSVETGLAVS